MSIVVVNVSQTSSPTPNKQQKKGAFISQGGTTLQANATQLLTTSDDLASILKPAAAITTVAWLAQVVTATTAAPHGIPNGDSVEVVIAGVTPAGYNGTYLATSTGASAFTYALASNPGIQTVAGTYRIGSAVDLIAMNTTFWAQGSSQAVWVLELGLADVDAGVAALNTYINNNTIKNVPPFYRYLMSELWADSEAFNTFAATKSGLTGRTYFHPTMSLDNYTDPPVTTKAIVGLIPAPAAPATEWSAAAPFWKALSYDPSSTNKVTPFDNTSLVAVTPYPEVGNATAIANIIEGNVNIVSTGSEGGLTNLILNDGTGMDGRDVTYWYSVDWVQFTVATNVAAAVINGANNPQNPLLYNQNGIERVQAVAASTMANGVSYGLVLGAPIQVSMTPTAFAAAVEAGEFAGQTAVNAQPFLSYSADNPTHYAQGIYGGIQIAYTPARGFKQIIININVTDFVV